MSEDRNLRPGDKVAWNTSQGETSGTVKKRLTQPTKIKSHEVKASPDHPEYLVETDRTHREAAHKPEALHKKKKA